MTRGADFGCRSLPLGTPSMPTPAEELGIGADDRRRELLKRLLGPEGPEVTCEECFELLDEYVELELAGEDADRRLPGMRAHMQGCPACHEDHESLRDFVLLESQGDTA